MPQERELSPQQTLSLVNDIIKSFVPCQHQCAAYRRVELWVSTLRDDKPQP